MLTGFFLDNPIMLEDGQPVGSGMGSDTPASVGRIHDVFAEFKKTFGMARGKQKAALTTLYDRRDYDVAAGSLPRPVSREPRAAADDGVTDTKQAAEAVGGDAGRNNFSEEESENMCTS